MYLYICICIYILLIERALKRALDSRHRGRGARKLHPYHLAHKHIAWPQGHGRVVTVKQRESKTATHTHTHTHTNTFTMEYAELKAYCRHYVKTEQHVLGLDLTGYVHVSTLHKTVHKVQHVA